MGGLRKLLFCLLCGVTVATGAQKPSAAVIPLSMPAEATPAERIALLSRLIAELNLTDSIHVMKMSVVEKALRSMGLKQARQCSSVACWKNAAKAMGVDRIIALSIDRVDDACVVEALMVDGVTGEYLVKVEKRAPCAIEAVKATFADLAGTLCSVGLATPAQKTDSDSLQHLLDIALKETAGKKDSAAPVSPNQPVTTQRAVATQAPAATTPALLPTADIVVLPFNAPSLPGKLIDVLSGDFCTSLAQANALVVKCGSEMAEHFERNKHEGLPDTCTQPACLAQWGMILGVPRVAAVRLTAKKNKYVAQAIMVEASSGTIVSQAEEKAEGGGVYEAYQRLLPLLAARLVKQPEEKTSAVLAEHPPAATQTAVVSSADSRAGLRIVLTGSALAPVRLFEPDARAKKKAYFSSSSSDTALSIPSRPAEFSATLKAAIRISPRLSLASFVSWAATGAQETQLIFRDTLLNHDHLIGSQPVKAAGPVQQSISSRVDESFVDWGIELAVDFIRTRRLHVGMSLGPQLGFAIVNLKESDFTFTEFNCFVGGDFYSTYHQWRHTKVSGRLSSLTVGAQAGLYTEVMLLPYVGLRTDIAGSWKVAPWLVGILDGTSSTDIEMSIGGGYTEHRDSVFVQPREARKGDYLGTGAYVDYVDPAGNILRPHTAVPVMPWRSFKEYAGVRLSCGIVFYF